MVGSNFDRVRIVVVGDAGNTGVHMIEVYKIMHDMYDRSVALELPRNVSSTTGNKYKLQNHSFHFNFRKFSFAARVVNAWNSLQDHVVAVPVLTASAPM